MLSLLLTKQKKDLKKEYTLRFVNVLLTFILISSVAWIIFLFPSYIIVYSELGELEKQSQEADSVGLAEHKSELEEKVKGLNQILTLFDMEDKVLSTEIIREITNAQTTGVSINVFNLGGLGTEREIINIQGSAANREALKSFSIALSNSKLFEEVELPLSSFVKESDIPFSISLYIQEEDNDI